MGLLRLILALAVVSSHVGGFFGRDIVNASLAVNLFFVISGYYMALILNTKYIGFSGANQIYFLNRFLRLWPTYIICLIVAGLVEQETIVQLFKDLDIGATIILLLMNLFSIGAEWQNVIAVTEGGELFFDSARLGTSSKNYILINQNWTLGLEILFYLVAPFFIRQRMKVIGLFFACIGFFLLTKSIGVSDYWRYHFFPITLVFFLIGSVSYYFGQSNNPITSSLIFRKFSIYVAYPITILILVYPAITEDIIPGRHLGKVLYLLFGLFLPFWISRMGTNAIDRILGESSYPVYLSHSAIFILVIPFVSIDTAGVVTAMLTIAFAVCVVFAVERPIDKYRKSRIHTAKG